MQDGTGADQHERRGMIAFMKRSLPLHLAWIPPALPIAVTLALSAGLAAQQTKVVPRGMDFVEGPSVLTNPFSRTTDGMQILFDASEITSSVAVINSIRFRPSQSAQTSASFTKPYSVTAYIVPTTAAAFEAMPTPYDPNTVIAGATPTVVFSGPITFPAGGPLAVAPAPFSIVFPFTQPFVYDSSLGNLLFQIDTTDLTTTPGTYRIDAVQFRFSPASGVVADIDGQGCTVLGNSLSESTLDDNVIIGGSIDTTFTSSAPGAFPALLSFLGLDRTDVDLALVGMPGCTARTAAPVVTDFLLETGGVWPLLSRPIPASTVFIGLPLVSQALGFAPSGQLADSAVSNAEALRIGESTVIVTGMCGFRTVTSTVDSWFHGAVGQFTPVMQLEGVFP